MKTTRLFGFLLISVSLNFRYIQLKFQHEILCQTERNLYFSFSQCLVGRSYSSFFRKPEPRQPWKLDNIIIQMWYTLDAVHDSKICTLIESSTIPKSDQRVKDINSRIEGEQLYTDNQNIAANQAFALYSSLQHSIKDETKHILTDDFRSKMLGIPGNYKKKFE